MPRAAQRVLLVLAASLLVLGFVLGGNAARRPLVVDIPDAPDLEVLLDLNAATALDLETLPGIGTALAARIVTYRDQHGRFRSVDELRLIPGFGENLVRALRPLVTVHRTP